MRRRYSILVYWLILTLPIVAMTGLAVVGARQVLGSQFANWWKLTTPKLIVITIITVTMGIILGIPLAKTLASLAHPLTVKGSLEVFSMTGVLVVLNLLFCLIAGFADIYEIVFIVSYAATILLLTFAIDIAIYCTVRG